MFSTNFMIVWTATLSRGTSNFHSINTQDSMDEPSLASEATVLTEARFRESGNIPLAPEGVTWCPLVRRGVTSTERVGVGSVRCR
jgi:hypothetical protein